MKRIFLLTVSLVLTLLGCTHNSENKDARSIASIGQFDLDGVWKIQGTSSKKGPYSGVLELRRNPDSTWSAIRIVEYSNFKFNGLQLQEVWTGKVQLNQGQMVITYLLRTADYITKIGSSQLNRERFNTAYSVVAKYSSIGNSSRYNGYTEDINEVLLNKVRLPSVLPIWRNERTSIKVEEGSLNAAASVLYRTVIIPVIQWYHEQPEVIPYKGKEAFVNESHFVIRDPTEFYFYRNHPTVLRVTEKVVDELTLAEAYNRWSAYSYGLKQKSEIFQTFIENMHINEFGIYSGAILNSKKQLVKHTPDGDAALWTGMYVGSQAMRYLATQEPRALDNMKKSLNGLFTLMDITGNPSEFARSVMPVDESLLASNPLWKRGTGAYSRMMWLEGGNNDMWKGLVHGMAWAYKVLTPNDPMWKHLNEHAVRIEGLKISDKTQNKSIAYGLAALGSLQAGKRTDFAKRFKRVVAIEDILDTDEGFYYHGISDWSGINLNTVSTTTEILIAESIQKHFPSSPKEAEEVENYVMNESRESLIMQWQTYNQVKRDFVTVAAYAFAYRNGTRGSGFDKSKGIAKAESSWEPRKKWDESMRTWIWSLREFPVIRGWASFEWDHSFDSSFQLSFAPRLPWKSIKDRQPVAYHMQSNSIYPMFESSALTSNFAWKDAAFEYRGQANAQTSYPAGDYLYTYWMARWSGLLGDEDGQIPKVDRLVSVPDIQPQFIRIGDGTAPKLVSSVYKFTNPNVSNPVTEVRLVSNNDETQVLKFEIVFADNGEVRSVDSFVKNLQHGESFIYPIALRPIQEIRMEAKSAKIKGGRGEFRVELGIVK